MIHPSYTDLMNVVNANVEPGDEPVVNSRYSIVLATAKRARQIIDGAEPLVTPPCSKPLSVAVSELNEGKVKILTGNEVEENIEDVTEGFDEEEMSVNDYDVFTDDVPEFFEEDELISEDIFDNDIEENI